MVAVVLFVGVAFLVNDFVDVPRDQVVAVVHRGVLATQTRQLVVGRDELFDVLV
jgi:4-hydroxybenzoate polyprenyltransferase